MVFWKVLSEQVTENYTRACVAKENLDSKPENRVITWTGNPVFVEWFSNKEDAYKRMKQIKGANA